MTEARGPRWKLVRGDCVAAMREAAARGSAVHAVVTDPPYHLTSGKGAAGGFMGKAWDGGGVAFDPDTWRAALDLLPPGGHLVAFSSSRTYHRMACAIEDAGFEVRDQLMWLYGTGFPKSLDVSKAIDKARDEDKAPVREVCRFLRAAMDSKGLKSSDVAPHFDCDPRMVDHWAARDSDSQPNLPTEQQWIKLKSVLSLAGDMDEQVACLNARKGEPGDAYRTAEVIGEHQGQTPGLVDHRFSKDDSQIRASNSAGAEEWQGWGTALKPAHEPIVLARKPLSGTVAANVLEHGTGALNVDTCRVPTTDKWQATGKQSEPGVALHGSADGSLNVSVSSTHEAGRWPANVVHDGSDEVDAALGEPSRFFYCAKASKAERAGSKHPTVKPVALMRWLVRLVTPPGGVVLDPFAGTGTTGQAAWLEGHDCVMVEADPEHQEDVVRRMAAATGVLRPVRTRRRP